MGGFRGARKAYHAAPGPGGLPARARAGVQQMTGAGRDQPPSGHVGAVPVDCPDPVGVADVFGAGGVLPVPVPVAVDLPGVGLAPMNFQDSLTHSRSAQWRRSTSQPSGALARPRFSVCQYLEVWPKAIGRVSRYARQTYYSLIWHDNVCNTVQEPTVTSTIVAKKTTTWGESGFPSEFLAFLRTQLGAFQIFGRRGLGGDDGSGPVSRGR